LSKNPEIIEIYLVGSVANGAEQSKDVDVVVGVNGCFDENCDSGEIGDCIITQYQHSTQERKDLDVFCFDYSDLEKMKKEGDYRILQSEKLLYSRN